MSNDFRKEIERLNPLLVEVIAECPEIYLISIVHSSSSLSLYTQQNINHWLNIVNETFEEAA